MEPCWICAPRALFVAKIHNNMSTNTIIGTKIVCTVCTHTNPATQDHVGNKLDFVLDDHIRIFSRLGIDSTPRPTSAEWLPLGRRGTFRSGISVDSETQIFYGGCGRCSWCSSRASSLCRTIISHVHAWLTSPPVCMRRFVWRFHPAAPSYHFMTVLKPP